METRTRRLGKRAALAAGAALLLVPTGAGPARAFSVFGFDAGTIESRLAETPRWSAEPVAGGVGLHDGLQVAVDPDFAPDLGAETASEVSLVHDAVESAFRAWENPVLEFDLEFEASRATLGPESGAEIDVLPLPGDHPLFLGTPFFGRANSQTDFVPDRLLTNGQRFDGPVVTGADILINVDAVVEAGESFGVPIGIQAIALTRLVMHEAGHTLGLAHPGDGANFDTDLDPTNDATIDPSRPFADLIESPNIDEGAIMMRDPCGEVTAVCGPLFFQELQPDDRLGRDVLYPVPEPGTAALLAAGLLGLAHSERRSR